MTAYVVLREQGVSPATQDQGRSYIQVSAAPIEATNAQQACRRVAEGMTDEGLADGVTLVAIPARNWTSGRNTFAAKTERKLIRS